MARKNHEEMAFGSDSFLDVVANIVGILIILIVVVGVKVAHSPAQGMSLTPNLETQPATPAAAPPAMPELPQFPPLPEIAPDSEMLAKAKEFKAERAEINARMQQLNQQQSQLSKLRNDQAEQIAALRKQITSKVESIRTDQSQISTLQNNVAGLTAEVQALQQKLGGMKSEDGPVEKLTHELPPIGRVVTGDEIHFRLENNRVSRVPVTELAREVQYDIDRRKEILLSRNFYQGRTRPLEGYLMEYVLQRQEMTLADEMRNGRGMIRIGVSGWVIKEVGPLMAETADVALSPGSFFQRTLGQHGPTATVTFWVYPDSFEIHQKLTKFVHDANFWVASRPLPQGVPIAGSPNGSKSVAQ